MLCKWSLVWRGSVLMTLLCSWLTKIAYLTPDDEKDDGKMWDLFPSCSSLPFTVYFPCPRLHRYRLLSIFLASEDTVCLAWFNHNWFSFLIKKPWGGTDGDTRLKHAMQLFGGWTICLSSSCFDTKTYQKMTYTHIHRHALMFKPFM